MGQCGCVGLMRCIDLNHTAGTRSRPTVTVGLGVCVCVCVCVCVSVWVCVDPDSNLDNPMMNVYLPIYRSVSLIYCALNYRLTQPTKTKFC